jgi:hypothetical protein
MASVPSAKQIRALPFVPGRMLVSAIRGRNWFGVRASGRIGGVREREVCRYESSAGLRRTWCVADGAIAGDQVCNYFVLCYNRATAGRYRMVDVQKLRYSTMEFLQGPNFTRRG